MAKKKFTGVDTTPWVVKSNLGKVIKTGFKGFSDANTEIRKISRQNRDNGSDSSILTAVRA